MVNGNLSVAHVVRQFDPSIGGLEDSVRNLVRAQRDQHGLDARVVTLDSVFTDPSRKLPARETIGGTPVRRLHWRGSSRYPVAPSVLGAISGADVVHVHGIDFFFDFLAAARRLHSGKLVASTHGGFFHTEKQARLKRLWFQTITRASASAYDAIVACSENDASMFGALGLRNLSTIENGADLRKFEAAVQADPDPRRLLYFGRFAAHKRIAALFDLLAALLAREPGWHLVVAGSPSDQQPEALREAARLAGVTDAVRFCIRPDDCALSRELSQAQWFVCASAHEGFGIAAVEAASAGLIPVLSDIPPFRKLVQKLGHGVLFDPLHANAAADRLLATSHQTQSRADIARAAQAYDWTTAAAAYVRIYASISARGVARDEMRARPT